MAFSALRLGLAALLGGLATAGQAAPPATIASLQAEIEALQAKVNRLEDKAAIEKLQRAYGYYLDKQLWSESAALFSDTGSVEIAQRGVYRGRKGIDTFFIQVMGHGVDGLQQGRIFNHLILQGIVDVDPDGLHARGRWRALQWVVTLGGRAIFAEGPYENIYVKENGVWKIQSMHYFDSYHVTEADGFTRNPISPSGETAAFPPDEQPTVVYDNYPGVYVPPFHYPNPVSGRPWTAADTKAHSTVNVSGPPHAH
ncbi:MAG TPA: nuclear transport factor 2 family protein [Sphingomonadaceae bacterium]|nr:nuclear transport factor 2 family protein [Sphingomonadaceae bacterium]